MRDALDAVAPAAFVPKIIAGTQQAHLAHHLLRVAHGSRLHAYAAWRHDATARHDAKRLFNRKQTRTRGAAADAAVDAHLNNCFNATLAIREG